VFVLLESVLLGLNQKRFAPEERKRKKKKLNIQSLFGECGKRFKVEREREREREKASDDRRWSGGYRAVEEETRMKHGEQQGNGATTSSATFV
jgi:hypothetical protein